jgi:bifunctional DNA-binding transcriptional regulator/antitoxin component of YhaV-PrlF toxin-antitoxin module
MSETNYVGEGKVSGNQASIPAHIRRAFGIEDGDELRWWIEGDELRVEVVEEEYGVFDDFEPVPAEEGEEEIDVVDEHDRFGIEDGIHD